MEHGLIIHKNGQLWFLEYQTSGVRGFSVKDVSTNFHKYLFQRIHFGPGVVLKDFLLLAQQDLGFWEKIINNELKFLKQPLIKMKEPTDCHIDKILFYDYISRFGPNELETVQTDSVNPDCVGYLNHINEEGTHETGIDHIPWNMYLDKPLGYRNSTLFSKDHGGEINLGLMEFNLVSIMKLILEMNYDLKVSKKNTEYIIDWDKPLVHKT